MSARIQIDNLPTAITGAQMVWAVLPDGDKQLVRGEVWLLEIGTTRAPDEAVTARSVHVRVGSARDAQELAYALSLQYVRIGIPEATLRAAAGVLGQPIEATRAGYLATTFAALQLAFDAPAAQLMAGLVDQLGTVAAVPGAMIAVCIAPPEKVLH